MKKVQLSFESNVEKPANNQGGGGSLPLTSLPREGHGITGQGIFWIVSPLFVDEMFDIG